MATFRSKRGMASSQKRSVRAPTALRGVRKGVRNPRVARPAPSMPSRREDRTHPSAFIIPESDSIWGVLLGEKALPFVPELSVSDPCSSTHPPLPENELIAIAAALHSALSLENYTPGWELSVQQVSPELPRD